MSLVLSFEVPGTESSHTCVDYCVEGFKWDADGRSNVAYEDGLMLAYGDGSCQLRLDREGSMKSTLPWKAGLLGTALSGGVV